MKKIKKLKSATQPKGCVALLLAICAMISLVLTSCDDKLFQSTIVIENNSDYNDVITELLLAEDNTEDYDYVVWNSKLQKGDDKSADIDSGDYCVLIKGYRIDSDGITKKDLSEIGKTKCNDTPIEFHNADTITFTWDGENLKQK